MDNDRIVVKIDAELEDLIPGFFENRRKDIRVIREALEAGDLEPARSLGHSMKGAGGGYGFQAISEMGAALETAAKSGDGPAIRQQTDALSSYLDRVKVVFE
jgi:HPt (histidine-containing phosphotransfer) domain-containing protein